jgi:hypothetical protein
MQSPVETTLFVSAGVEEVIDACDMAGYGLGLVRLRRSSPTVLVYRLSAPFGHSAKVEAHVSGVEGQVGLHLLGSSWQSWRRKRPPHVCRLIEVFTRRVLDLTGGASPVQDPNKAHRRRATIRLLVGIEWSWPGILVLVFWADGSWPRGWASVYWLWVGAVVMTACAEIGIFVRQGMVGTNSGRDRLRLAGVLSCLAVVFICLLVRAIGV